MRAIFNIDDGTVQQYPTAMQDSRARKVSLVEIADEMTPPPNRHGIIGRLKAISIFVTNFGEKILVTSSLR